MPSKQASARQDALVMPDRGGVLSIEQHLARYRRALKVSELAPILGISTDALYEMVRLEKITPLNFPGIKAIVFDPGTVAYWLRQHNPILKKVAKAS